MTFYKASKGRLVIYVLKGKLQFIMPIVLEYSQPEAKIFQSIIHVF
jgi:hypothetical protein